MTRIKYEVPEISFLYCEMNQVLCSSQTSSNFNIGIGDWEMDDEDYGGSIK